LERGKGLRGHDEESLRRIKIAERLGEVGRIDIRDESERQLSFAVEPQCLVCHHRAEIRAANPDIDNVTDSLAGVSSPFSLANAVCEVVHLMQRRVHVRYDIPSI